MTRQTVHVLGKRPRITPSRRRLSARAHEVKAALLLRMNLRRLQAPIMEAFAAMARPDDLPALRVGDLYVLDSHQVVEHVPWSNDGTSDAGALFIRDRLDDFDKGN